jgi:ferredoxin-NADP reductase
VPTPARLELIIRSARQVAVDVISLELALPNNDRLPSWQPGAHVDVQLPSGLVRQYSLHGDPADANTYRIAVLRAEDGRGGSAEIHQLAAAGVAITVGQPRNNFALESAESAEHYLFVAGGIGITPLLAMARQVASEGRSWSFLYGGRSRNSMAFIEELEALPGGRVLVVPQDELGLPDLATAFIELPAGASVYCCGPTPMLDAVVATGSELRPEIGVRLEHFSAIATDPDAEPETAFEVTLARTLTTVKVPAGTSILDAIRPVCPDVMSSCEEGICSSCETEVLEGTPDHRDSILTPSERATNRYMMICVSRALSARLVLDL